MSLFEVDREKCKRDGICVAECPFHIIEQRDDSSVPTPVDGAEEICIACGHCVAVCPRGAFSLAGMKPGDCPPVRKDLTPGIDQAVHFIRSRRSIRVYMEKEVERERLVKLIDTAHYAPTGKNSQQVKWIVINNREAVNSLAGMVIDCMRYLISEKNPAVGEYRLADIVSAWEAGQDFVTRGAPGLVIVHAPKEYAAAQADSLIALTTLDLAAQSFGLGTCWAGYFMIAAANWPPLQDALSMPDGNACFGAMMVGYPKHKYHRLPLRNPVSITWL